MINCVQRGTAARPSSKRARLRVCGVRAQNERGITVLGVAVGFNREAVVDELLARGADLEAQDPAGNTVLFYAAGEEQAGGGAEGVAMQAGAI